MPLKPALAVRGTVAGHRLGALEGGGGSPLPMHSWGPATNTWGGGEGLPWPRHVLIQKAEVRTLLQERADRL